MIAKVEHYQHFNASYLSKMILRAININLVYCIPNNKNVGLHHSDILVRPRKPIWVMYGDNNILHLNSILTVTVFCHLRWVGGGEPENREGLKGSFRRNSWDGGLQSKWTYFHFVLGDLLLPALPQDTVDKRDPCVAEMFLVFGARSDTPSWY